MKWPQETIKALADYYAANGGEAAIDAKIATLVDEVQSAVTVTSVNFEGAAGSAILTQKPAEIMAGLYLVKKCLVEGTAQGNQAHGRLRRRNLEV